MVAEPSSSSSTGEVENGDGGGGGGGGGKRTVVVAVKLDSRSKELLTWALVKVALPGHQVIALHVLDSSTGLFLFLSLVFCFVFVFLSKD